MTMHITLFLTSNNTCSYRSSTSIRSGWWQRSNPISVHFSRNRPLEKLDGNHQAAFPLYFFENALHARQGTTLNQHSVAQFQERPGHYEQSGLYHPQDRFDLSIWNRRGNFAEAYQVYDARRREYLQPVQGIQPAKHVTWKKKLVDLFGSIRPAALSLPGWRELFIAAIPQMRGCDPFVVGAHPDCKPRVANNIRSSCSIVKYYLGYHGTFCLGFQQALSY
jgi:hypothetical protein